MRAISHVPSKAAAALRTAVVAGLFLALYGPLVPGLVRDWTSHPMLSHGFAIPLISGFIAWSKRRLLRTVPTQPSTVGIGILSAALALSVIGQASGEPFLTRLSLVFALLGVVWSMTGWAFTRALLFPIAYLLLMIPPPYVLTKSAMTQARLLDAAASAALLRAIGIPVFREANLLHLPNMTLEVADPCSSVLALIALTALAAAYAYMTQRHPVARIVLCLSAFPLAVASNIFRIVILATGVYYAGPIMVHYITEQTYGLINFLVFTLLLAVLGRALMAVFDRALQASERHAS